VFAVLFDQWSLYILVRKQFHLPHLFLKTSTCYVSWRKWVNERTLLLRIQMYWWWDYTVKMKLPYASIVWCPLSLSEHQHQQGSQHINDDRFWWNMHACWWMMNIYTLHILCWFLFNVWSLCCLKMTITLCIDMTGNKSAIWFDLIIINSIMPTFQEAYVSAVVVMYTRNMPLEGQHNYRINA
jgi:hypothetical protein